MINLDLMDQELPLERRPCQGLPRVEDGNQGHQVVDLIMLHCQSKAWGELAEDRLRYFGLTFPWIDGSTKSFARLGSSIKTLGKRNLPFCIQVGEDSLAGAMESHEVDTEAFNPLLLSLLPRQS